MGIKVQNVRMARHGNARQDLTAFLGAVRDLKVGQSFLTPITSYHRNMISAAKTLLERNFITRKEGDKFRIGRVS